MLHPYIQARSVSQPRKSLATLRDELRVVGEQLALQDEALAGATASFKASVTDGNALPIPQALLEELAAAAQVAGAAEVAQARPQAVPTTPTCMIRC